MVSIGFAGEIFAGDDADAGLRPEMFGGVFAIADIEPQIEPAIRRVIAEFSIENFFRDLVLGRIDGPVRNHVFFIGP